MGNSATATAAREPAEDHGTDVLVPPLSPAILKQPAVPLIAANGPSVVAAKDPLPPKMATPVLAAADPTDSKKSIVKGAGNDDAFQAGVGNRIYGAGNGVLITEEGDAQLNYNTVLTTTWSLSRCS